MVSRVEGASVRRIEEGLRSVPPTEEPRPSREYTYEGPPPPAEVIRRQVRAMAVLPGALRVSCERHGAAVGQPCHGRAGERGSGVCGDRLSRRSKVTS